MKNKKHRVRKTAVKVLRRARRVGPRRRKAETKKITRSSTSKAFKRCPTAKLFRKLKSNPCSCSLCAALWRRWSAMSKGATIEVARELRLQELIVRYMKRAHLATWQGYASELRDALGGLRDLFPRGYARGVCCGQNLALLQARFPKLYSKKRVRHGSQTLWTISSRLVSSAGGC